MNLNNDWGINKRTNTETVFNFVEIEIDKTEVKASKKIKRKKR